MVDTLWSVAREFDPRGYGVVLKQKLRNWCDCGCSTEHLGEVCERTVREDELHRERQAAKAAPKALKAAEKEKEKERECLDMPKREKGKGKEWDGRGGGVWGWGTKDEEDMWEKSLDLGGIEDSEDWEDQMTMGEQMEWRYLKAEREKELGNAAYKLGKYETAINYYLSADTIEPELPHYRLNAAQACLQLSDWRGAEKLCTQSLRQHPHSVKALWRRAKARRMQGKPQGAARDLRQLLGVQPANGEARDALGALLPALEGRKALHGERCTTCSGNCPHASSSSSHSASTSSALSAHIDTPEKDEPDVPFELDEFDHTRLSVLTVPVSLVMPDTGKEEAFAYPSWERYRVERVG
ncbi:TPR-like protein [Calocera cornea HHB12733]|uniref:TPR-like protein n=1 Tax=Calocera cornea HHB12733 TaxID=1353952 RepID=A0A165G6R5_9BASI|nr:TPR-like protein [Calocera cornea HHB12733]